ncbi:DUF6476 family protein [Aliiroseovarius crassostreae]|uniref:DUF6476 family protein n=1 Tax=Aliiroseovarius crassostreae TaxID=154981 RepID=UPI00220381BE|nr:DUF6476 family protein [Aliiroseovarius crassostreae]UWQ05715.1 hypothetical protein K3X22_04555 [Aliiroseovarius crassostreae]
MDNTPQDEITTDTPIDGTVRFLKILVTTLTATTIIGLIVLITVIVMRFQQESVVPLPQELVLPQGAVAVAVTRGPGWFAVVTEDERILILEPDGRTIRREVAISKAP